jgi:hypothetical protein
MAKELITAEPTKRLFIETLTQDVSLQTCILDLIDNSFDSYVRNGLTDRRIIKITIAKDRFELYDNCGGIDKDHLKNNVFKFGAENTNTTNPTLGMYGIGLKRSIFKIGNLINIQTDDGKNLSTINLNVPLWQESKDWNFEFDVETSSLNKSLPYTNITISKYT